MTGKKNGEPTPPPLSGTVNEIRIKREKAKDMCRWEEGDRRRRKEEIKITRRRKEKIIIRIRKKERRRRKRPKKEEKSEIK